MLRTIIAVVLVMQVAAEGSGEGASATTQSNTGASIKAINSINPIANLLSVQSQGIPWVLYVV